ncbi:hypothetical protein CCR75_008777 [Bremia lactucae]|uniref:HNH nuclease domain-containing protein n=1 Tax=Bremia lactucae TaxID=4779 RepID=A0A976FEB3_BRELC|nr:hypothetical protein CCR75_008777 [Bremia lactucae]
MVTLLCVIVGVAGKAFSVDIDDSKFVGHLKDKIKEKNKNELDKFDAKKLQLFLAKTADNKWFSSFSEDVKKLKEGETTALVEALTSQDKKLQGEHPLEDVLIGMERPSARQIHVLVIDPEQENDPLNSFSSMMEIFQILVSHMLTAAPTTKTTRNIYFKRNLCQYYNCYQRETTWVRCMLLNVAFPNSLVTASHLFRRSNEYVADKFVKISDIDDVKNGMLLFKPLKYAYDHFHISFVRDNTGAFRLKLFDPNIRNTRLIDMVTDKCEDKKVLHEAQITELLETISLTQGSCEFNLNTTFGDVDGTALAFIGPERPFNRCLNLQARVARVLALKNGWIEESYDFPDFWSDVDLNDKMDFFHRSLLEG